jgi:hypothetical protein
MEAIAEAAHPEEMDQVFSKEQNGDILNRAVNSLQGGEMREFPRENLSQPDALAERIKLIMFKHYPESKNLSNTLYEHILLMLAAPNDEILLGVINNIF